MLEPFALSHFEAALATPRGWAELAIVAACIGLAWFFDRSLEALGARTSAPMAACARASSASSSR